MKTAIFLSVRNKATRLPGKVLLEIRGKPVIEHLINRLKKAQKPDMLVMTTSTNPNDASLAEIAARNQIYCFRGSEDDKLQRYLDAADKYGIAFATVVDGDDLFCDPVCIDRVIGSFVETGADYIICRDLPLGVTPFGIRIEALRRVCELKAQSDTEVWGGYFTQTGLFRTVTLEPEERFRRPELRMTLDYQEDFTFFKAIFDKLYRPGEVFSLDEIIDQLARHPAIPAIHQRKILPSTIQSIARMLSDIRLHSKVLSLILFHPQFTLLFY